MSKRITLTDYDINLLKTVLEQIKAEVMVTKNDRIIVATAQRIDELLGKL